MPPWQPLPFLTRYTIQMMQTDSRIGADTVIDNSGNRVFYRVLDYQVMATLSQ